MDASRNSDGLSLTGKRWVWPEPQNVGDRIAGVAPLIGEILVRRGVASSAELSHYLQPSLTSLDDPMSMADMAKAVERILAARAQRQTIVVFGDYDVDGVSSTAILIGFFRAIGLKTMFYIPDRRAEGYGLNAQAVRELASQAQLLVTVDCGITAIAEIELARTLGLDVIVVDHHQPPPTLPPSIANLDPHRADCGYPFKDLCAAGVAFFLAAALRRALRDAGAFASLPEPDLRDSLDLVALATVADMVPLKGANRTLVAAGLRRMTANKRPGLKALFEVANVDAAQVTATDLSFRIGPRINARGRIGNALEAVDLMLTDDPERARALAAGLDKANRERRDLEVQTVEIAAGRAAAGLDANRAGLVLYDPCWHPGILGLVATRLVSRFHRPAIVIGENGKGSGRTFEGLDLHATIESVGHLLERFGGHRAAAGVTVRQDRVDEFSHAFDAEVRRRLGEPPFVPTLRPDAEVDADTLSLSLLGQIERLAPFGQANPEPLMVARRMKVKDLRRVGDNHLKLRLGDKAHDAIGFGLAGLASQMPEWVDVAFHLNRNTYGGRESVQLKIEDLRRSS
ncbi:MAG: single-stranded-DNA-specific exonuclease RecJ [Deltaproteobacteria bacterium]|nr:single-stranded-DNA-specific exonuclease RecJ [Deltaproteobacteria bacterium]